MILQVVVLYVMTSLLLFVSVTLCLWLVWSHWSNTGQEPDWKTKVLSLFVLFPSHSLFGFLLSFTGEKYTLYTMSVLISINAYILYQVFYLFLFLFNKQSSLYFQGDLHIVVERRKDSPQGYLPETLRAKTNYCFIQCIKYHLTEKDLKDETHPLLVYGAKYLSATEILLVGQIIFSIAITILTLSLGHIEQFVRWGYILSVVGQIVSLFCVLWIGLFLIVVEQVVEMYRLRFKLFIISLPILSSFLVFFIFPQSLASFIIQTEQIFLLISTLWIFSPDEHSHILATNTHAI